MSKKHSAGLLLFRERSDGLEVLLVHPGGPFWSGKDDGAWSVPKGELEEGEDALQAAKREFSEETGAAPPAGDPLPLDPVRQPSGKTVHVWALRGEFDVTALKSNTFSMEWPPKSGQQQQFPEVDRGAWFPVLEAARKIMKGQLPLLEQLHRRLSPDSPEGTDSNGPSHTRAGNARP